MVVANVHLHSTPLLHVEPTTALTSPTTITPSSTLANVQPNQKHANPPMKVIQQAFDAQKLEESAKELVRILYPDWKSEDIELVRFTEGITNTLLKCSNKSHLVPDDSAVLLRAYGSKTDVLIDRERECDNHLQLSSYNLAPPLLARFQNGLLYSFVPGKVCSVEQMSNPEIFSAVARRLGEWHGTIPVKVNSKNQKFGNTLWGIMRRWSDALPANNEQEKEQKETIERELEWVVKRLEKVGVKNGLIFGHCDLLNGNVVILPQKSGKDKDLGENKVEVHFIDYEYATPCPAAFDLSNHFAEWTGFACDYNLLPSRSQRRAFITDYLLSFHAYKHPHTTFTKQALEQEVKELENDVETFRGIPGLYWGIWALIQAEISKIDFDYAGYAKLRLQEYWDWKKVVEGTKSESKREQCWARA